MDGIDEPLEQRRLAAGAVPPGPRACRRTRPAGGHRADSQPHQSRPRRILRQPGNAGRRAADRQYRALGGRPGHVEIARGPTSPTTWSLPEHATCPWPGGSRKHASSTRRLRIAYDHLDPQAAYSLRVVYAGEFGKAIEPGGQRRLSDSRAAPRGSASGPGVPHSSASHRRRAFGARLARRRGGRGMADPAFPRQR